FIANVECFGIGEPDSERKGYRRRVATLIDAAGERGRESGKYGDRKFCEIAGAAGRQRAGISDLINGVDAVAATAFADVQVVVKYGQAEEIVIFARLVRFLVADLRDRELANLVDVRGHGSRLSGEQDLGTGGSNEVHANLRSCKLAR